MKTLAIVAAACTMIAGGATAAPFAMTEPGLAADAGRSEGRGAERGAHYAEIHDFRGARAEGGQDGPQWMLILSPELR